MTDGAPFAFSTRSTIGYVAISAAYASRIATQWVWTPSGVDGAATFQGPTQSDFVGVLEIATHR